MANRTKHIVFFLSLALCLSCRQEVKKQTPARVLEKPAADLDLPKSPMARLNPKTKSETSQWLAFVTAQSQVSDIRNYGAEYALENASATLQIMQNLQESIPQIFRTTPVEARINVLVTLAHVLKQESENRDPDKEKIGQTAKKILLAFGSLKIQLNEVFTKTLEEFQMELEVATDSI